MRAFSSSSWSSLRFALTALGAWSLATPSHAADAGRGRIARVTDGDTFRLESGERIRIRDIDAPETQRGQARCAIEITRGRAATRAASALLQGRQVRFVRTGRSYRRTVARVTLDGRDLAALLVQRGIARRWMRGDRKPDWC